MLVCGKRVVAFMQVDEADSFNCTSFQLAWNFLETQVAKNNSNATPLESPVGLVGLDQITTRPKHDLTVVSALRLL